MGLFFCDVGVKSLFLSISSVESPYVAMVHKTFKGIEGKCFKRTCGINRKAFKHSFIQARFMGKIKQKLNAQYSNEMVFCILLVLFFLNHLVGCLILLHISQSDRISPHNIQ